MQFLKSLFARQSDREKAIEQAREVLDHGVVVFDTETTGLGEKDVILEIAAVDSDGRVLVDQLIRPHRSIPREATAVHGLKQSDFQDSPSFEEVWPEISRALNSRGIVAAYNMEFDGRMLTQTADATFARTQRESKDGIQVAALCLMELYGEFHGERDSYRGGYRWHRLDSAARQCGVRVDGVQHRALTDARMALGVLRHIAEVKE